MTGKKNAYNMRLTIKEREESMATGKALDGKPYAGNPHVRFDEGEVAPATTPRRGSLLYKHSTTIALPLALLSALASAKDVTFRPAGNQEEWNGWTESASAANFVDGHLPALGNAVHLDFLHAAVDSDSVILMDHIISHLQLGKIADGFAVIMTFYLFRLAGRSENIRLSDDNKANLRVFKAMGNVPVIGHDFAVAKNPVRILAVKRSKPPLREIPR